MSYVILSKMLNVEKWFHDASFYIGYGDDNLVFSHPKQNSYHALPITPEL
jgi:hypothetical protein